MSDQPADSGDDRPELPARAPGIVPETAPFWEATAAGRIRLPRCLTCGLVIWYPREHCPAGHPGVEWIDIEPVGSIYSFSIARRGQGSWSAVAPYVVAYVELDAGPRVLTNIVGCDPEAVAIGQRVVAEFHSTGDDEGAPALVRFRPQ